MKKKLCRTTVIEYAILFVISLTVFIPCDVSAISQIKNSNYYNIDMNTREYNNLINLGYTAQEIYLMNEEEFNQNKNLEGKIVSEEVKYYQTILKYSDDEVIDSKSFEISKEDYNLIKHDIKSISTVENGYVETNAKMMKTTIISINSQYRYKVSVEWKYMPKVRSYDIIGLGLEANKLNISNINYYQAYCFTSGVCESSSSGDTQIFSTGVGVSFQIPTDTSLVSLVVYLYYDVSKLNGTINVLKAYGDYSHAVKAINRKDAKKYTVNNQGINVNSTIVKYYDDINCAIAVWNGTW